MDKKQEIFIKCIVTVYQIKGMNLIQILKGMYIVNNVPDKRNG